MRKARTPPALTVAVCTQGRLEELRRALASLLRQKPPVPEILVIDNAPEDGRTHEMVEREFPEVHYLEEPVPGLGFARNRALSAALGDVVAFLDEDAVADPGWAASLLPHFRDDRSVGAVAGRIPAPWGERPIRLPKESGRLLIASVVDVGSGCSLAVHRWRMLRMGGFDEALDRPSLPGGGIPDAVWRLLGDGWSVVYEPGALALREPRPIDRRALVAFLVKSLQRRRERSRLGLLAFLAWQLLKPLGWSGLWAYSSSRRECRRLRPLASRPRGPG